MKIIEKKLSEKLKLRRYSKRLVPVLLLPPQKCDYLQSIFCKNKCFEMIDDLSYIRHKHC